MTSPRGPLTVLHLPTDSGIGGTEKRIAAFIRNSNPELFRHVLMPLKPLGEIGEELADEGYEVEALGLTRLTAAIATPKLVAAIRRTSPDILQTYLYGGNVLGRPAGRMAGVPAVVSGYASTDPWMTRAAALADMSTARFANAHLANSDAVADAVARRCRVLATSITVVHTGREIPGRPASPGSRDDGKLRGIAAGRIHRAKGYDVLVDALALADKRVHITVAGGGSGRDDLARRASAKGVGDRIEFLGIRNDVEELMRQSDFYVLSSRWEGLPGALIEAMAIGLPVVATAVGGVPEAVIEGETGHLAEPDSPSSLADALNRAASSSDDLRAMGRAGRVRAEEHFSVEAMVSRWEAFYRRIARLSHRPGLGL